MKFWYEKLVFASRNIVSGLLACQGALTAVSRLQVDINI